MNSHETVNYCLVYRSNNYESFLGVPRYRSARLSRATAAVANARAHAARGPLVPRGPSHPSRLVPANKKVIHIKGDSVFNHQRVLAHIKTLSLLGTVERYYKSWRTRIAIEFAVRQRLAVHCQSSK